MKNVAILGSGSWGTALAFHLANAGHDVRLWGRNAELIDEMKARRANAVYLPDVVLPAGVVPTASLEEALHRAEIRRRGAAVARHARGDPRGGAVHSARRR